MRDMWESCEGPKGHILRIFFIPYVKIRCGQVPGTPHATETIHITYFTRTRWWTSQDLNGQNKWIKGAFSWQDPEIPDSLLYNASCAYLYC